MKAPLTVEVNQLFTEGDKDFGTVEELQTALEKMWRFRANNQFEPEMVMDYPMFPQVESCPKEVQGISRKWEIAIMDNISDSMTRGNVGPWIDQVSEWIS